VDVYFGRKDEALIVTNGKGEFDDAQIHVPRAARPGERWVTALERNNDRGAQKLFLVRANWKQFRFDVHGTGANPYENVLSPNNVRSLQLKWIYNTGSSVFSSPALANGVVYIGSDDSNIYALDADTGAKLWSYATGGEADTSPAVENGIVYAGGGDYGTGTNTVYAVDASTGVLLWTYVTGNGVWSSPAVANGTVYIGSNDYSVYALDAANGAKLWSFATGAMVV
jgi:outer membrane protein assembly factor BamB